jgi:soluble lytic murein transglycosylase-like protein
MRCFRVASNRVGFSVPIAAALFVCSGSASAHSYQHAYRHTQGQRLHYVHYGHRLLAMQQNAFAPTANFTSENFAAPYATQRSHLGQTGYARYGAYDNTSGMAATQAGAAGLPASLVERVIRRESGGNPRAVHGGNYGLMQIRLGTARAMGYSGSAAGLLDSQTNMTYALRYLAGAYRAAGGNENRAIALYARGYYGQAKAQGFSPYASGAAAAAGGSFGGFGPAYQTAWPAEPEQYGLRHRRHYRA